MRVLKAGFVGALVLVGLLAMSRLSFDALVWPWSIFSAGPGGIFGSILSVLSLLGMIGFATLVAWEWHERAMERRQQDSSQFGSPSSRRARKRRS